MRYVVDFGHTSKIVEIREIADGVEVFVDDQPIKLSLTTNQSCQKLMMLIDNYSYDTEVFRNDGKTSVFVLGNQYDCDVEDERLAKVREVSGVAVSSSGGILKAPMPGLVVRILKEPGDTVAKGDPIIVVEAMKMENELKAPSDGTVAEIHVKESQAVDKNQLLITITE